MRPVNRRSWVLLVLVGLGLASALLLGLHREAPLLSTERWRLTGRFLRAAVRPTLTSQSDLASPLLPRVVEGARNTLAFATAAMSLALVVGLPLGIVASERFWRVLPLGRGLRTVLYATARALLAVLRSVHEILWGILMLAAFGLHPASAVIAIAIPFAGTLAKVVSEMLDEADDDAAEALRWSGASASQAFACGVVPLTLADLGAYTFYRFECALRSAAILGFFGFPTLGKFLYESFGELYFREAWTYLYALLALLLFVEGWSALLRQRLRVA